ncbi:MAG: ATP-binding protein [Acidobacteria bacterium]|nr:ATP-binding protein [Acidobacteriota bacterium]
MTTPPSVDQSFRPERVAPHASFLIESMRDIGYSLESALADIVDNSIAAGATEIRLFADTTSPSPRIAFLDNGHGMTQDELLTAMRAGAKNPLDSRPPDDLGRFGLGLKTASFSQCRRLTVMSKQDEQIAVACWDLDYVAAVNDWIVQVPFDTADIPWSDDIGSTGTLVLWEQLDRLIETEPTDDSRKHLTLQLDAAIDHLELVFHRFLAGERGLQKVSISINGRSLNSFDPFHASHPATMASPLEQIRFKNHTIQVRAFTLPHHSKVTSNEWERHAGRAGYIRNQGFYVYRAKRLIIHGTWFGLARLTPITQLARVRIDMPNQLDKEWQIDVRKSSAQLPRHVRDRLRQIIDHVFSGSKNVYTSKGHRLVSPNPVPVWRRVQAKGTIRYEINADHPLVLNATKGLRPEDTKKIRGLLEFVSAGLPVDALFADVGTQPDQVANSVLSDDAFHLAFDATYSHLRSHKFSADEIRTVLKALEPFRSHWQAVEQLLQPIEPEANENE